MSKDNMTDRKVAVVTGACGGIGVEIVRKFLKQGYQVAMLDLSQEKLEATAAKQGFENVSLHHLDVSNQDQVKDTVSAIEQKYGHIDALINTAGIVGRYDLTVDYTFENFRKIYEVNVFGTFLMIEHVLPIMVRQNGGAIVDFGSVSGMRGYTYEIGYGSSKAAVISMTQNVANEYAKYNIRANSVSPGWVDTEMTHKTLENYKELGFTDCDDYVNTSPIPRPARPEEIANCVYFLCSDEASYVTGANLVVDGGKLVK